MPYTQVSLATLRQFILNRIQNSSFYTTRELNYAVSEAVRLFSIGTGYWKARFVVTTVAKRCIYDCTLIQSGGLPQIIMPLRMSYNGIPMDPQSIDDMDATYSGWQVQTTATTGVPTTPVIWGPMSTTLFFIWPADDAGNGSLAMDAIIRAPVPTQDSETINIDTSEMMALVDYCHHILSFKRGGAAFKMTMPQYGNFLKAIVARNAHLRAAAPFTQYAEGDGARRTRPRRTSDMTGKTVNMGVR